MRSKYYRGVGHGAVAARLTPAATPRSRPPLKISGVNPGRGSVVVALGGALAEDLEVGTELDLNLGAVVQEHLHLVGGTALVLPFDFAHCALANAGKGRAARFVLLIGVQCGLAGVVVVVGCLLGGRPE